MKITKYPQSTLVLEKDGRKILIDPGSFTAAKFTAQEFIGVEAIFLTHQHPDHVNSELIASIIGSASIPVYANEDTHNMFSDIVTNIVSDQEQLEVAGFNVKAHNLPHVPMVDGSAGPPNTGYIFDETFFHSGDGTVTAGIKVEVLAVPIAGPDLSLRDAHECIITLGAKIVIPIHYSIFSDEKPAMAVKLLEMFTPGIEMRVLANQESTDF